MVALTPTLNPSTKNRTKLDFSFIFSNIRFDSGRANNTNPNVAEKESKKLRFKIEKGDMIKINPAAKPSELTESALASINFPIKIAPIIIPARTTDGEQPVSSANKKIKTIPNKEETFLGTRILLKVPIINAIKIERCKPLTANMWEYPASRKDSVTE